MQDSLSQSFKTARKRGAYVWRLIGSWEMLRLSSHLGFYASVWLPCPLVSLCLLLNGTLVSWLDSTLFCSTFYLLMTVHIWLLLASFKCLLSHSMFILTCYYVVNMQFQIPASFPGWNFNIHTGDLPPRTDWIFWVLGQVWPLKCWTPVTCTPSYLYLPERHLEGLQVRTAWAPQHQSRLHICSSSSSCSLLIGHESEWRKQTLRPALALWLQRSATAES